MEQFGFDGRDDPVASGVSKRRRASVVDAAGMEARADAIRLKEILGVSLTERELMCLQIERNGMACHTRPLGRGGSRPDPDQDRRA